MYMGCRVLLRTMRRESLYRLGHLNSKFLFSTSGPVHPATSPLAVSFHCIESLDTTTRRQFRPTDAPHTSQGSQPHRQRQMPVVGLEAWFAQIPPVTRTWLALSVLTSVAVVRPLCESSPSSLVLEYPEKQTNEWLTHALDSLSHGSNVN